jgi:hypothetical protein
VNTAIVQTLGVDGSIVLPADVLRRWGTDVVVAIDTPDGLIIGPFEPAVARRMAGKYAGRRVPWGDGAAE